MGLFLHCGSARIRGRSPHRTQEELLCLQGNPLTPTSELSQTLLEPRPDHRVCSQPNSPFFIALERARVRVWIRRESLSVLEASPRGQ